MKTYKWQLRKGSKKEICPICGKKRFVPYVLASDNTTLAGTEYGRCDREQSCGYHRYPNGETMVDVKAVKVEPKEMLRFNGELPRQYPTCEFYGWMQSVLGEMDAFLAINEYQVGSADNMIIWWQTDRDGVTRTGKMMKYLADGHRDKSDGLPITWSHKHRLFKDKFVGEELKQCLFGEHLLAKFPDKPVMVVESEKTAVMMSRFVPECVWVATGGAQGIKSNERLAPLIGRKVTLVPDNGQYWNWLTIAQQYGWQCGSCEDYAPFDGADILDIVLELLSRKNNEADIY